MRTPLHHLPIFLIPYNKSNDIYRGVVDDHLTYQKFIICVLKRLSNFFIFKLLYFNF